MYDCWWLFDDCFPCLPSSQFCPPHWICSSTNYIKAPQIIMCFVCNTKMFPWILAAFSDCFTRVALPGEVDSLKFCAPYCATTVENCLNKNCICIPLFSSEAKWCGRIFPENGTMFDSRRIEKSSTWINLRWDQFSTVCLWPALERKAYSKFYCTCRKFSRVSATGIQIC